MALETEGCIKLDPASKKLTCPGDPVRLNGRQGHYRFVGLLPGYDNQAEIVGPYFSDPARSQETMRVQMVVNLKPATKGATRKTVAMSAAASALSNNAKRKK